MEGLSDAQSIAAVFPGKKIPNVCFVNVENQFQVSYQVISGRISLCEIVGDFHKNLRGLLSETIASNL